jgi:hypothetical protein
MDLNLERIFTYHAPFGTQVARYQALRDAAKTAAITIQLAHTQLEEFATLIGDTTPTSPEQTQALQTLQTPSTMLLETIRMLQAGVMWANAAIAIHETAPPEAPTGEPA